MNVPNGSLFGIYRALVVDAADPEKQGRVKVHIPDLMVDGDEGWTGKWCTSGIWARPGNNWIGGRNTYDTKGPRCNHTDAWYQGSCMIPPKGSHVFLFFEKGDPSHPFYFAAADYGQTKVLPENRWGPKWWMKWTPIKTREGRTVVISDDPADARVEITGKKRHIHNTPDGDTESVFEIAQDDSAKWPGLDGNQSVVLIDERPSHEKILIKDYRGNFIKMIQDEAGRNDQLHIVMKDDIHIETKKNLYLYAHENIHITAKLNIFVTALDNMYVYVEHHFSEMAELIDRYSQTNDNRTALIEINDWAGQVAARGADVVRDMGNNNCSRSSGGVIADEASGAMSIKSGGKMSIKGGGNVLIDGPQTTINQGAAPIAPSKGIIKAAVTPKATLPTPDPDRHFTKSDDGWAPVAPDKNKQNRPHAPYWKPQYVWTKISQSHGAQTSTGGGGGSSGGGSGGGAAGGGGSSGGSGSSGSTGSGSGSGGSSGGSGSGGGSTERGSSLQQNPVSIAEKIKQALDNSDDVPISKPNNILDIIDNAVDTAESAIIVAKEKAKDLASDVSKKIIDKFKPSAITKTHLLLSAIESNPEDKDNIINEFTENIQEDLKRAISTIIPNTPSEDDSDIFDPSKIEDIPKKDIDDIIDDIIDNRDNISDSILHHIDDIFKGINDSLDPIADVLDKLDNDINPDLTDIISPLTLINPSIPDIMDNILDEVDNSVSDTIDDIYSPLSNDIISEILKNIPAPQDIKSKLDSIISDGFISDVTSTVKPIPDIIDGIKNIIHDIPNIPSIFPFIVPDIPVITFEDFVDTWDNTTIVRFIFDFYKPKIDLIIGPLITYVYNKIHANSSLISVYVPSIDNFSINYVNDLIEHFVKPWINNLNTNIENIIHNHMPGNSISNTMLTEWFDSLTTDISDQSNIILDNLKHNINYNFNISKPTLDIESFSIPTNGIELILNSYIQDAIMPIEVYPNYTKNLAKYLNSNLDNVIPLDFDIDLYTKSICDDIKDQIYTNIFDKLDLEHSDVKILFETPYPQWSTNDYKIFNDGCKKIQQDLIAALEKPDIFENIDIKDSVVKNIPNSEYVQQIVNDATDKCLSKLIEDLKIVCTNSILLTEDFKNNEFNKDIDLTSVYKIPGVESSKHKCDCDDPIDPVWCTPDIIGGCGVTYEYMLFLKDNLFNTIMPILYNDGIKTIGFSLNPDMSKLNDIYDLHDIYDIPKSENNPGYTSILTEYNNLIDTIYHGSVVQNNKFLNRIDKLMTLVDDLDFCCIINLFDFECKNYKWLQNIRDMDKYTHELADEFFIDYVTELMRHVFYKKQSDGTWKRRTSRIIVNLGNRKFINPSDVFCKKFVMYPNCGFIRELVMQLAYKLNVSSNYMSITANEDANLYYYNPYTEFKSYDDMKNHVLVDYEICTRDFVDDKTNGEAECVKYEDGNVSGGYLKWLSQCSDKSYAMSYIDNLNTWCEKPYNSTETIINHFSKNTSYVDSNIMNYIYSPNARKCMRYFYKGHEKYFQHHDYEFDPETGDLEG